MLSEEENRVIIFFIIGTLFVLVLVVFLLLYVYLHQMKVNRFKQQLHEQELKKQQELFMALNEGEENERKRLAEELHDGIGAKLSGLKMNVEYLKTNNPEYEKNALIEKIAESMNETIVELREISQNLLPSYLSSKGLQQSLTELTQHFNVKNGCHYQLYIEVDENQIKQQVSVIYRIISELLNNIQKHASASIASVQVGMTDENIQLIVEDNGVGFNPGNEAAGIGLLNISNRVALWKGIINIDSTDKGTTVIVELPITVLKMKETIEIYLADDHQIVIDGLTLLLKNEPGIVITGSARNGETACEEILKLKPDIALIDLRMPGKDGLQVIKYLGHKVPTRFIILSMMDDKRNIAESINHGAKGYLLKNIGREELISAIKKVSAGEDCFPDIKKYNPEKKETFLTPRELDILKLVLNEYTSQQIAEKLSLSQFTVDTHRKNIYKKTRAKTIVGLAKYAADNGIDTQV